MKRVHGRVYGVVAAVAVAIFGLGFHSTVSVAGSVSYKVVDDGIAKSLTGKPGNAANGRKVAINRKQGNCLACHKMPIPEQQFHGEIAPDLEGVADRLTEAEMRLRVVDPKVINDDTIMPAFYRSDGLHRVLKKFDGKAMLTAEQVEDVIAYLLTLKE